MSKAKKTAEFDASNEQLELVYQSINELSVAKIICGFANASGGILYFGVKSNGKIVGTDPSESYSLVTAALESYYQPTIELETEVLQFDYKYVLEVKVPASKDIHRVFNNDKWIPYYRLHNENIEVNDVIRKYLKFRTISDLSAVCSTEEQEELLSIIKKTDYSTYTQIARQTTLKKEKIESILAYLLTQEKIVIDIQSTKLVYRVTI